MARTPIDPRIERLIQLAKGFDDPGAEAASGELHDPAGPNREAAERKALSEVIHRAILQAKQTQGLTQAEIAARIGISAPLLTHWVKGYRAIPDKHLLELATVLGVDFRQELIRHFRALTEESPDADVELARLITNLNQEAKAPLLRLLKRLQKR
ncbi:MAG: helix-turn-helix transcriptional regulator [Gammaproteobacteria bacterium]|jgi:transcriptional regulator with XRE-family HTH domain|nr:helix-turn-helix transcriptional regulator [Gammaproteobacteria bacterium]